MKHNIYADGKFQNIEFKAGDLDKSVGVVESGTYNFTTEREETVECLTGVLVINGNKCLPGQKITIGANELFTITAEEDSSYICSYR